MVDRNQDQIDLINEELEDLDRQVRAGDLDAETADGLRDKYGAELLQLNEQAASSGAPVSTGEIPDGVATGGGAKRLSGRAIIGTAVVAIAITFIAVFAVNSLTGPSTDGAEGVASDVATGQAGIDLSKISNEEMEAVVAANPDIVNMRLALARRYFDSGDFDQALTHYMVILDLEKHPEALTNVGWMTYLSGRPDIALEYVEAALQRQPTSLTATWFLGNIQFSLGNFDAAEQALTTIVEADGVPDDVLEAARSLLIEMAEG
jgi:tetratricopeptide (TPR) repeat protein